MPLLRVVLALFIYLYITVAVGAEEVELFRIRVENSTGGVVQVSLDSGRSYTTIGKVNRPATTTYQGFAASAYVPDSTVAATAVHGLRLKVKTKLINGKKRPMTISLVPAEFVHIPPGYGGHIPYDSGIYTDIPSGTGIFRNFAPLVGNPMRLERGSRPVYLPADWEPSPGDVIIIIVKRPEPYLREIEFDNKVGGAVRARYTDGREEHIATVTSPLGGVGRFDGTSYTGVGLINTNHPGVITVSTAPISMSSLMEGYGDERRGGFEIQPYEHAKTQPPMPQAMVVKPVTGGKPLEGAPPLFFGYIGLAYDNGNPEESLRVEVKIHNGQWQSMPQLVGRLDTALSDLGVSHIRFVFPKLERESLKKLLKAEEMQFLARSSQ